MVRIAIYCRISRDDDGAGLGVKRQEDDCRRLVKQRGWPEPQVFIDNDFSAYSGRLRPSYQKLLTSIRSGGLDVVVAWAPERLHRSPRELEDFLELIERTSTGVETVKAGTWDVSSSHGRLVARMLGAVSRAESERIGERVSRAHQQAKAEGRWRGPIPFGLQVGQRPGMPVPHPVEAPIVCEIFDRVVRGEALTRIAADLNERGVKPRRGRAWTHTSASRLVASAALGGLVYSSGDLQPAAFAGVVDADTWRTARDALARRPRGEARRPREKLTLLGGIMTCASHRQVCFGGSATHAPIYVTTGPGACHVSITRRAADDFLTELLLRRLEQSDARSAFALPTQQNHSLDLEAAELRDRRDQIAGLIADGLLAGNAARARLEEITQRLQQLEMQRTPPVVSQHLLDAPRETWSAWTQPERRQVIRLLFAEITLAHVGPTNGPRADPRRISATWAAAG